MYSCVLQYVTDRQMSPLTAVLSIYYVKSARPDPCQNISCSKTESDLTSLKAQNIGLIVLILSCSTFCTIHIATVFKLKEPHWWLWMFYPINYKLHIQLLLSTFQSITYAFRLIFFLAGNSHSFQCTRRKSTCRDLKLA